MARQTAFIDKIGLWMDQASGIGLGWLTAPVAWSQFAILGLGYLAARRVSGRLSAILVHGIEALAARLGPPGGPIRTLKRYLPLRLPVLADGLTARGEQITRATFGLGGMIAFGKRVFLFLAARIFARDRLRVPFLKVLARYVLVPLAALYAVGLLDDILPGLDKTVVALGNIRFSVLSLPGWAVARACVLETFDGKWIVVPNDHFITTRVVNLSDQGIDDGQNKYLSQLNFAIRNALKSAGIAMPYPHRVIEVKGGPVG